jgi:hypothetical protein
MPETRPAIKLDFTTGLDNLPPRPKMDATTTLASVTAGRELGFVGRGGPSPVLDGRRLRSRGANVQMNIKVTAQEKEMILQQASLLIQDPASPINNIGEFIVEAVEAYRASRAREGDRYRAVFPAGCGTSGS